MASKEGIKQNHHDSTFQVRNNSWSAICIIYQTMFDLYVWQ